MVTTIYETIRTLLITAERAEARGLDAVASACRTRAVELLGELGGMVWG
jgi:hypothetical protein